MGIQKHSAGPIGKMVEGSMAEERAESPAKEAREVKAGTSKGYK